VTAPDDYDYMFEEEYDMATSKPVASQPIPERRISPIEISKRTVYTFNLDDVFLEEIASMLSLVDEDHISSSQRAARAEFFAALDRVNSDR